MEVLFTTVLGIGLALSRSAAAFLLTPLFGPRALSPVVRNSLFVAFGLIVFAWEGPVTSTHATPVQWTLMFAHELVIGLVIGFYFGAALWAAQSAGEIYDAKVGANLAAIDPLSGESTSVNGAFLGNLAAVVFMASGGLLVFVGFLLESYRIWPMGIASLDFVSEAGRHAPFELGTLMALAVALAVPGLVVISVAEFGLGLMNRFSPQLNVFGISLSIKSWLATAALLASSALIVNTIVSSTLAQPARVVADLESRPAEAAPLALRSSPLVNANRAPSALPAHAGTP